LKFVAVSTVMMGSAALAQVTFQGLSSLPGGSFVDAYGLSANGSTAVGVANSPSGSRAFSWTAAGGTQNLGTLPGDTSSRASSTNHDGSVTVGYSRLGTNNRAVQWTGTGMQILPGLSGTTTTEAVSVSADGLVAVGTSTSATSAHAVRWTSGGAAQDLGLLPNGVHSFSRSTNQDGSVVVGYGISNGSIHRAFRWTSSGGLQNLGILPGTTHSQSWAVNGDGSVVVGVSTTGSTNLPFRWTQATGMQPLPLPSGATSAYALGISGDARIIVGYRDQPGFAATMWNDAGAVDLATYLPTLGVDLTGWFLTKAWSASADGSVIIGEGVYQGVSRGWIASGLPIPSPATAAVIVMTPLLVPRRRRH
jgi:uncharacterized membrane protein